MSKSIFMTFKHTPESLRAFEKMHEGFIQFMRSLEGTCPPKLLEEAKSAWRDQWEYLDIDRCDSCERFHPRHEVMRDDIALCGDCLEREMSYDRQATDEDYFLR